MTDKRDLTPAEDSISLRLIVYLMTMTCISASCIFVKTAWPVIVLAVALTSIGSVVSYQYRNEKQNWMQWVVVVGVFAVGANAASEFMDPSNGAIDFWPPVVHFIAGTFSLHTFDLKSRSDINLSAFLGALILCVLSPVVRSLYFGLAVFSYICLGTIMLYFDCMSRTLHNWLQKPMQPAPVVDVANISGRRKPRGSVYFTIALLPLISAICFLLLPRSDNLVDTILSSLKHLDLASIMKSVPWSSPLPHVVVPRHEFSPLIKRTVEFKKRPHEIENRDEVDKKLKEMGVDKRKLVKVKPKQVPEKTKSDSSKGKVKEKEKKKPPIKEPGPRVKSNRPKDNKLADESIDLDTDPPDSSTLLYKITSTRLFYGRRTVYDDFDGRHWKRSKDKIEPTDIDVKDPAVAGQPKDASAPNPEPPPEKELTPEEEADKELAQEKLAERSKRETGFGPDMAVDYIFTDPPKGDYHIDQAAAFRLPAKLPCVTLSQSYEVASNVDALFPSAWLPQDLTYKGKKVVVDDYGQIRNSENIKKGAKFNFSSQWPVYNLLQMRQEPGLTEEREKQIRDELSNYLQLPDDLSDEVLERADAYAGKTGNWFAVAERICLQLRAACTLENEKPADYKPADDRIYDFLFDRKAGNNKDFTTAFVLMCRGVGLPARVVYGFSPGSFNKTAGTQDVRMFDAVTWAEVYIPDYGWVPFDATPGGVMPGVKRDEGFNFWSVLKWICAQLGIELDEGLTPQNVLKLVSIVISCLFLLAGLIIGLILFLRWRKNQRDKNPWQDAAWRVWMQLAKDFKKARMERMPTETPSEFVERINNIVKDQRRDGAMSSYELPQALTEFFVTYEAVHFGNKDGLPVLKRQAQELRKLVKANRVNDKKADSRSRAVRSARR